MVWSKSRSKIHIFPSNIKVFRIQIRKDPNYELGSVSVFFGNQHQKVKTSHEHWNIGLNYQCCGAGQSRDFLVGAGAGVKFRSMLDKTEEILHDILFVHSPIDKRLLLDTTRITGYYSTIPLAACSLNIIIPLAVCSLDITIPLAACSLDITIPRAVCSLDITIPLAVCSLDIITVFLWLPVAWILLFL